jgi:hypothetical protein
LHDKGVRPEWEYLFESAHDLRKLPLEDEDVKGEKNLYAVKVCIFEHGSKFFDLERRSTSPGIETGHTEVYSISAVVYGSTEHIPIPDRGEDFWGLHMGIFA